MGFIDKAEMRNVVALVMIGTTLGSWAFFLSVVEFDDTKKLDATILVMIFANVIIGTVVGVFAWLGFKQGQTSSAIPTMPPIPDGHKATYVNGAWMIEKA